MNINKIINAKDANMVISKQMMKNVSIVVQKKMVAMLVTNVNIKKTLMEKKQKILFVKDVILLILIFIKILILKVIHFYQMKENVIIAKFFSVKIAIIVI